MNTSPLSPENISSLIDHVMKSKDPATVGLRKILKKKEDEAKDFSFHAHEMKSFDLPDSPSRTLSEEETLILQLEKKVNDLQTQLKKQQEDAKKNEQDAILKGKQDGIAEGLKKGTADTTQKYEKKIDELQKKMQEFLVSVENSKREIVKNSEHILLRLCLEIVKKTISNEVSTNKELILSVVKKAVSYIGDHEKLIIRVAPSDFETISNRKDFWIPVTERLQDIMIEKDERIKQGGCIVESNSGVVDARLGIQLEELSSLIEKIWEHENAPVQSQESISDNPTN